MLQGVFHGGDQGLGVGAGGKGGGCGKVHDQAHVTAALTVAAAHQALVHEHRVRAAFGHLVHGFAHVHKAVDGPHAHAVIQRHDDGAPGFSVENALHPDSFADLHRMFPCSFGKVAAQLAVIVFPCLAPGPSGSRVPGGIPPAYRVLLMRQRRAADWRLVFGQPGLPGHTLPGCAARNAPPKKQKRGRRLFARGPLSLRVFTPSSDAYARSMRPRASP